MHLDCNKYGRVPANLPKLFDTRIEGKVPRRNVLRGIGNEDSRQAI